MGRIFILFQHVLPHHLLSRCTGWLAELERPRWLKNKVIGLFINVFDVAMEEAEEPDPRRYPNFNAFFTRPLRPGVRPLAGEGLVSPADGQVSQIGRVDEGRLLQAKGRYYSVDELLAGDANRSSIFRDGFFATIYLSPRDYHRVHMPIDGRLTATTYVPGRLFSVNGVTANGVDRLFARNERLVCHFDTELGPMAMVLVGAMIVAGIETVWGGRMAPASREVLTQDHLQEGGQVSLLRGAEMGRFYLGSTVILLLPPDSSLAWRADLAAGSSLRMGEQLSAPADRR